MQGTIFPSDDSTKALTDGILTVDYTPSQSPCQFGMTFKSGFSGVLSEAKIFITDVSSDTIDNFSDGNLVFEGSNDNFATSTSLYEFDENVNEGWNWIPDVDKMQSFNSYRFNGKKDGSCRISEMSLVGVEAI